MKKILFLCVGILTTLGVCAQDEGVKFMDNPKWEEVLSVAAKENKLIFLDCYTTWCGPCKALAKDVFPKKEAGDFFNPKFINVKMDMEKGDGIELNKRYKKYIPGFPTMLIINSAGDVIHRVVGFHAVGDLIQGVDIGLKGMTVEAMAERYKNGERSLAFIKDYLKVLNVAFMREEMGALVKNYVESLPAEKLKEREVIDLYLPYLKDIYSPQVDYIIANINHFNYRMAGFDRYELSSKLNYAISSAVREITKQKVSDDEKKVTVEPNVEKIAIVRSLLRRYSFTSAQMYQAQLRMHELKVEGDFNKLLDYMVVAADMSIFGGLQSAYYFHNLRYIACNCVDKKILKRALDMAELQMKDVPEDKKSMEFNSYKLMADLCDMLKIKEKSKIYREIADKGEADMREKYKEFIK